MQAYKSHYFAFLFALGLPVILRVLHANAQPTVDGAASCTSFSTLEEVANVVEMIALNQKQNAREINSIASNQQQSAMDVKKLLAMNLCKIDVKQTLVTAFVSEYLVVFTATSLLVS